MIEVIKVCILKCRIRPENYELYGEPSKHEIACRVTQFLQDGQTSVINITKHETEPDIYWINDGVINCLAARKLADEGHTDWLMLNAIVTIPNIDCKTLIISLNTTRIKTKRQRCAEALYLIEQMPLTQGKEDRIAPTTGEPISGRTNAWIGQMVGLAEHTIATLRSALDFRDTDPAYFESLMQCELDSWAEMKRVIQNKKEQIAAKQRELSQKPTYQPVAKTQEQSSATVEPNSDISADGSSSTSSSNTPPAPTQETQPVGLQSAPNDPPPEIEIPVERATPVPKNDMPVINISNKPKVDEAPKKPPPMYKQFKQYKRYKYYHWNSLTLPQIVALSIQVVITSPPYWDLKDYIVNLLGNEKLKEDYIKNVAAYFSKELKRVLKKRGSLFLNCADTIKDGAFQTIPQLLLAALLNDGWHLVGDIIWHKPKLPNNKGADGKIVRLQHNTEAIYHLVQEPIDKVTGKCGYDYYPFIEYSNMPIPALVKKPVIKNKDHTKTRQGFINPPEGKKAKNRWTEDDGKRAFESFLRRCRGDNEISGGNGGVRTREAKKYDPNYEHVAVMSEYMPVIPILECSKIDDTILDIFGGSGTVGLCAAKLDRKAIQLDLDAKNVAHGLGEYAAWHKEAYKCDPEEESDSAIIIPLNTNQQNSTAA
jgi:DNA modification methylase